VNQSDGWRLAILVASGPDGSVMFAVQGLAGLVPYRPEPDEVMQLGSVYRVRVSADPVTGGRRITDVVSAGDGGATP
jgi:hypothetical protein